MSFRLPKTLSSKSRAETFIVIEAALRATNHPTDEIKSALTRGKDLRRDAHAWHFAAKRKLLDPKTNPEQLPRLRAVHDDLASLLCRVGPAVAALDERLLLCRELESTKGN